MSISILQQKDQKVTKWLGELLAIPSPLWVWRRATCALHRALVVLSLHIPHSSPHLSSFLFAFLLVTVISWDQVFLLKALPQPLLAIFTSWLPALLQPLYLWLGERTNMFVKTMHFFPHRRPFGVKRESITTTYKNKRSFIVQYFKGTVPFWRCLTSWANGSCSKAQKAPPCTNSWQWSWPQTKPNTALGAFGL